MISDDEPIGTAEADLLMRGPVADRIIDIIQNRPTNAPLVLALHGPWGSGKSSVLALVREKLEATETVCVSFEPWLFNDAEQLIRIFFATVYKALEDAGAPKKRLRKIGEKIGGLVTVTTRAAGHEVDLVSLLHASPDKLREDLRKASAELGKRVVVIVDDVDRLPIEELSLVLKLIRLCGNFPFFSYVLAYDRRVVSSLLREKFKGDADYLDKIVQVEVPLPPVPSGLIAKYVTDGLREIGERLKVDVSRVIQLFDEGDEELRVLLAADSDKGEPGLLTRSLRDAKRFLNGLASTLPLVCHEVDLVDFTYLELVRIFFPAVHDELYESRFSFAVYDSSSRDTKRNERQAEHQQFAVRVRQLPRGDVAVKLVEKVFPVFFASLHAQNQHYGRQERWQRQMKASDPAYVERYFQLRVPISAVSRRAVRLAIDVANEAKDSATAKSGFTKVLEDSYDAAQLPGFLDALDLEAERIKDVRLPSVIEAIAAIAPRLAEKPLPERVMSSAAIAALRLLRRMRPVQANELAAALIAASNASFALQLTLYSEASETTPPDPTEVKAAFARRIEQMLGVASADIFSIYEYEWFDALRAWASPTKAAEYLDALLRARPEHWAVIADRVLERHRDAMMMRVATLADFISLTRLSETAINAKPQLSDPSAERLAQRFLNELRLVPALIEEVSDLVASGRVLQELTPGMTPRGTMSTDVWARARPRLQPVHSTEPWWRDLIQLYEYAESAKSLVTGIDFSSPKEALDAIPNLQDLRGRADNLVKLGPSVLEHLREVVGHQTALPLPPESTAA